MVLWFWAKAKSQNILKQNKRNRKRMLFLRTSFFQLEAGDSSPTARRRVVDIKIKFLVELFTKSSQIPKTESLVALSRVRNILSWEAHFWEHERSFAQLPQAILPNPLWVKRANSWLKTCFQSPFLQEKRFSKADCKQRATSKIIQWMIFDGTSLKLDTVSCSGLVGNNNFNTRQSLTLLNLLTIYQFFQAIA